MRPPFRFLFLGAVVASDCAHLLASSTPAPCRPNVIIVLTDDQGYGDLSCHGNPVLKTPNLDRLHAESIRFTDFHVTPMCTPSRGQLLTGVDALRNGATNVANGRALLRRGYPTIAELLAATGYRCGQFGKWHLGENHPFRPHERGFHEAITFPSSHIGSAPDFWGNDYQDDVYVHNGRRERYSGYTTDVFFREAMGWMRRQAAAGQPFLCYLPTAAPHAPLNVPPQYWQPYREQPPDIARFFGMISNLDENMGRLDVFLRETGLRENTLLLFLTDNGSYNGVPVYNAGMRGRKVDLYEGGHRVPCFVRWPAGRLRPPGEVGALTQVQDLVPTLLELCGVRPPVDARFDGTSLAPLLRGDTDSLPDRTLVAQFSHWREPALRKGDAAVLWRHWRLVHDSELYDLRTDPGQTHNIIAQSEEVAARLRAHYGKWWNGVSPHIGDFEPVVIGSDAENPVQLAPTEWADVFVDKSREVRNGIRKNGDWHLLVERAGRYEFELRRWPREAELAIGAAAPPLRHAFGELRAGVALPIARARLQIGGIDETRPVAAADTAATFMVGLPRGRTQLKTTFSAADGAEVCGAYHVYVTRR